MLKTTLAISALTLLLAAGGARASVATGAPFAIGESQPSLSQDMPAHPLSLLGSDRLSPWTVAKADDRNVVTTNSGNGQDDRKGEDDGKDDGHDRDHHHHHHHHDCDDRPRGCPPVST
jgi:hypothetical protein